MERKRKLPARAARVESASKKRSSTPPQTPASTSIPTLPPTQPVIQEMLPQSIAPGKPLPTIDSPQPENLSEETFQTIAESGVLSESLHRSRQKWLSEGIFEKFWTKPTKRKGAPEAPPNNPPKECMTKLGPVTISADPHSFEATMFAVKANPLQSTIPPPQQPLHRPIIQYGPPGGMMPPPPPTPSPVQQKPVKSIPQVSPRSQDVKMANTNPPTTQQQSATAQPNTAIPNGHPPQSVSNPQPLPPVNGPTPAPPPPSAGRSDPVIQMLAERAATDSDLKALMKTVANGEASPDQLRKFQGHIDELTRIQKLREEAKNMHRLAQNPPHPQASVPPTPGPQTISQSAPRPTPPPPQALKAIPTSIPPTFKAEQPQPQALRSKGPIPSTKPDITNVVFEFAGGNGDRYQFPRHSILEYIPGPQGQVIASFLIVRKGSSADSPSYDPELDYYQPITIRLFAYQGRQLEALQKVVAPAEEVRRYMDDVMDHATRAEYVLLAMRLPKDKEQTLPVESIENSEKADQMDHQITPWATTTSSTPIQKPVKPKKLVTEEEQYQAFINTVTPVL